MAMKKKNLPEVVPKFFEHEQFGEIRFIQQNGEIWFAAVDVCNVLGLTNPTMAVNRLKENERAKFNLGHPYFETNFVNEPGLYRLIFASNKPEAEKFKDWVYHEVLPSIRKYGYYVAPQKIEENLPELPPGLLNGDPTDFGNVARLEMFLEEQGVDYDYDFVPEIVMGEDGKPIMRYKFKMVIKD